MFSKEWYELCVICGEKVDREGHICSACLKKLPYVDPEDCCECCPRLHMTWHRRCEDCYENPPHFDRAFSALLYVDEVKNLILDYKFNACLYMRDELTALLLLAASQRIDLDSIDLVLPMPISLLHRFRRGYNQCDYIAKRFAGSISTRFDSSILGRKGFPRRQSGLGRKQRFQNVKNTFVCKKPLEVKDKTVLVIDDVFTTGASASECAKILKKAGAARVYVGTIARAE